MTTVCIFCRYLQRISFIFTFSLQNLDDWRIYDGHNERTVMISNYYTYLSVYHLLSIFTSHFRSNKSTNNIFSWKMFRLCYKSELQMYSKHNIFKPISIEMFQIYKNMHARHKSFYKSWSVFIILCVRVFFSLMRKWKSHKVIKLVNRKVYVKQLY